MPEAKRKRRNYLYAVGRRKTSTARVRYTKRADGKGDVLVNDMTIDKFFPQHLRERITMPITLIAQTLDGNFTCVVSGGGVHGQAHAVQHGITRILLQLFPEQKQLLKEQNFVTRDPRMKERKKPGLKRARRAPQWSKR